MDERDYLILAKKKEEEKLMDEYWLEIAKRKVWISKDKTVTPFSELELGHILNIINGLSDFKNKNCRFVISSLIEELCVRIKRKTPKYIKDALEQMHDVFIEVLNGRQDLTDEEKHKLFKTFDDSSTIIEEEFVGR